MNKNGFIIGIKKYTQKLKFQSEILNKIKMKKIR